MALTKEIVDDKFEIVTEFKHLQIRTSTIVKEDGAVLSSSYSRRVLNPGVLDDSDNLVDTDISSESDEIKNICNAVWTTDIKTAWKNHLISLKSST
tara:strand:- start:828 stop:1115 length:288 start_codon:yes stop_codon:yes gene_type:complete